MSKEVMNINKEEVDELFVEIKNLIESTRSRVYKTINIEIINMHWNIGKMIIERQGGSSRAKYGELLIKGISNRLTEYFGEGFSIQNLRRMRQFYLCYPIRSTLSSELSISHYYELIRIPEEYKRNFYMIECIESNWSVKELERQRKTNLYERLLSSRNESRKLELSKYGNRINEAKDIIKDPYILEFLDIKEEDKYLESDLEENIIKHLKEFLLELGRGFTYVGNQVKINIENKYFYPDLVFYNRILKCFVIIDLKIGRVSHKDIGQMKMYVNYYDRKIKSNDENNTIGILLSTNKNETIVKYTLAHDNESIFSSEYMLTIPSREELIEIVENEKKNY